MLIFKNLSQKTPLIPKTSKYSISKTSISTFLCFLQPQNAPSKLSSHYFEKVVGANGKAASSIRLEAAGSIPTTHGTGCACHDQY